MWDCLSLLCVYISQLIPKSDLCQHQLQKYSDSLERWNYSSICDSRGMRDTVTNKGWESDPGLHSWPVTGSRSRFSLEETEVIDLDVLSSLQFAQTLQTSPGRDQMKLRYKNDSARSRCSHSTFLWQSLCFKERNWLCEVALCMPIWRQEHRGTARPRVWQAQFPRF